MRSFLTIPPLVLSAALALVLSPATGPGAPSQDPARPSPSAGRATTSGMARPAEAAREGGIRVGAEQFVVEPGAQLGAVLSALAPLAARTVLTPRDTEPFVEQTRLQLSGPLTVANVRAAETLDALLLASGLVLVPPRADGQPWVLASLYQRDAKALRGIARPIDASDLESFASRHELVSVVLPLERCSAREIAAVIRPLLGDVLSMESVIGVERGNSVIVSGLGANVTRLARTIRELDASAEKEPSTYATQEALRALELRVKALERQLGLGETETADGGGARK